MRFSELSHPQIKEAVERNSLVLLPLGQVEEHGHHLPTGTDSMIADEVTRRIEQELEKNIPVVAMDTVRYGYSVKAVANWPGTIRLSAETVITMMREICASLAAMGFRKIAIINCHGNHPALLEVVSRTLADQCDVDVPILSAGKLTAEALKEHGEAGPGGSCHSGEMETSIMLSMRPDLVHADRYTSEDRVTVPNPASPAVFWSTWQRQKSNTGVYGDPVTATAEKGEIFLREITEKACKFLRLYYEHPGV